MSKSDDSRLRPIIYVRGYAGTRQEVEDTVATPYMGFNLGATKLRQRWDGTIVRHVFESPLVRLMKDHGYRDCYAEGSELRDCPLPPATVVIYRYYEPASKDLGRGEREEIEQYARGLDALIDDLRKQVCLHTGEPHADFRCYLVAHSLGGLICRAFLQNPKLSRAENRRAVDKVFTYATPHGGIDVRLIGNLPAFLTRNELDTFNEERMRGYLALKKNDDVRSLNGAFDPDRFFCLIGTNAKDYDAAGGWSTRAVGPLSDGLVRIENAAALGTPRAFVHRSHSGAYGIVNSEEGYQNLTRFLFGDVRVDAVFRVAEIDLPAEVQKELDKDKTVRASYHFEVVVRTRGARYALHSRMVEENSAIFRTFDEMLRPKPGEHGRHPHLFSVYLSAKKRTRKGSGPLVFAIDLRVRVPDYEIDGALFLKNHVEGSYLLNQTIMIAAVPPESEGGPWTVRYGYNPLATDPTPREAESGRADATGTDAVLAAAPMTTFRIPIERQQTPGITGTLELVARPWA